MLMDIRTGVIVWTEHIGTDAIGAKQESDTGTNDFYRRLRTEAEGKAVTELGLRLKSYLSGKEN